MLAKLCQNLAKITENVNKNSQTFTNFKPREFPVKHENRKNLFNSVFYAGRAI